MACTVCSDAACGVAHGRGRPRVGWVKVEGDFGDGSREPRWYATWYCLIDAATSEAEKASPPAELVSLFE